jgi:general secretion pathway protein C
MALTFDLDSLQLNKLLRKKSVDNLILGLRGFFYFVVFILFVLFVNAVVSGLFSTSSSISKLQDDIKSLPQAQVVPVKKEDVNPDYKLIVENKIFGELGVAKPLNQPTPQGKKATPMNLELIGTFVARGQTPYAIIEDKVKKNQDVFNIKDSVFDQATLTAIYNDRVDVLKDGVTETLRLDNTPESGVETKDGVGQVGENQFIVEEAELDKALENLPLLLTQARAVPYFKEGKAIGLRMFAIRSASLFEKIGLKNGDILKSVNGNSLGDLSQAMKLFERLKEERSLSVILERNNEEKEFSYQIK